MHIKSPQVVFQVSCFWDSLYIQAMPKTQIVMFRKNMVKQFLDGVICFERENSEFFFHGSLFKVLNSRNALLLID